MSAPDMPVSSAALLGFVAVVSGVLVVDVAARFFAWRSQSRKLKHLEMTIDELRLELRHVRSELGTIRTGNYTSDNSKLLNHVLDEGPPIERHVSFVPTGASSPSSMSDYFDVRDDWSPMSTEAGPPGDLMPLLADHSEAAAQAPSSLRGSSSSVVIQSYAKVDELHEQGEGDAAYAILKKAYDSEPGAKEDIELLWRLARACHMRSSVLSQKNPKRKELIVEGHKYALDANKIDGNNFNVVKWCAVTTGALADHLGVKERIQQGYAFKEFVDKAISMQSEYSLYHMRGRFSYSVANLSWLERKAAATFFATPPTASIDDALKDFLEVEKLRPNQWLENLLYVAKCYVIKNDKANVVKYLKVAVSLPVHDDADKETQEEAKQLLAKWNK
uniref:Regulator of microtubule dynamics protein 1 n=1 Tax=Panagrellus redivivus TaxID=6233 RepID=A0A7E4V180_PANRE